MFKLFILSCFKFFNFLLYTFFTLLQVVFSRAKLFEVCLGCFRSFQFVFACLKLFRFLVFSMCFTLLLVVLDCLGCVRAFQVVSRCCTVLIVRSCFKLFMSFSDCSSCQHDLSCSDCLLICFPKDRTMFQVAMGGVQLF